MLPQHLNYERTMQQIQVQKKWCKERGLNVFLSGKKCYERVKHKITTIDKKHLVRYLILKVTHDEIVI
ncbi:hypothetical protein CN373_08860 [Bacillus cereus]|nr:hypothetical protein CN373_08860 [Bacillus cereus]PFR24029.1 hypothetical protein COK19_18800 [Bacillus cereus]PGZ15481.1 hypothetical protein COE46_14965 [Bacillus cereus]